MKPQDLLATLQARGIQLEPNGDRLRYAPADAVTPGLREAIKQHKAALLRLLTDRSPTSTPTDQVSSGPRLPWQLERLVLAAASGVLSVSIPGVPDAPRYVMAWACTYLTGEQSEALERLWNVYTAWQDREVN